MIKHKIMRNYSPRVSLVYSGESRRHNRGSFQTGFRNPTTRDNTSVLIGSAILLVQSK
jgi:hypothetical protein